MSTTAGLKLTGVLVVLFALAFLGYLVTDAVAIVRSFIFEWAPSTYVVDFLRACRVFAWFVLLAWTARTAISGIELFCGDLRVSSPVTIRDRDYNRPQQNNHQNQKQNGGNGNQQQHQRQHQQHQQGQRQQNLMT